MLLSAPPIRSGCTSVDRFPLHFGGELCDARIAYTLHGDVDLPTVVVLGGISAGRNVTSWWQDFTGPGKAIDPCEYAVLGIDFIGGSGASTGPRGDAFPAVSTFDQARAVAAVLDDLEIPCIEVFIGSSYGGMVALAFASLFPQRVQRLLVISAAHEPHPMATALRSLQRRTIRLGLESNRIDDAIALARGIAMTTYRTSAEFAHRFDNVPERIGDRFQFPVESYLAHCGEEYARKFSPWGFLCLSESIDLHRVSPSRITVPTTLVTVESDTLIPAWQIRALASALGSKATVVNIPSIYGHDAFLKEVGSVSNILRRTLCGGVAR